MGWKPIRIKINFRLSLTKTQHNLSNGQFNFVECSIIAE